MRVILERDVKGLGTKGSLVEVAEGYGRNYLLPRGFAIEATRGNMRKREHEEQAEKSRRDRNLREAQAIGKRIDGQKLQLSAKVGDAGKLFGSITAQEIADRLQVQYKVEIDKRKIEVKEPIKNLGTFDIPIKVHPKVQCTISVVVSEA